MAGGSEATGRAWSSVAGARAGAAPPWGHGVQ